MSSTSERSARPARRPDRRVLRGWRRTQRSSDASAAAVTSSAAQRLRPSDRAATPRPPAGYHRDTSRPADRPAATRDVHLFHRLDSSLSNRQWRHVFRLFRAQRILFVSSGVLSVGEARQVRSNQKEMRSRGAVYAGWVRTRHAYDVCGDALTVTVACGLVMWTGGGSSLEPDAEALRV